MPLPLPVPSKAAIHALRGIALGTSCAIGVIVEDRRRRISTLRRAVSNKEKLRSAKQYHGMAGSAAVQLDDTVFVGDELHWHQLEDTPTIFDDHPMIKRRSRKKSIEYTSLNAETSRPSELEDGPKISSSNTDQTQSSPPPAQGNSAPLNNLSRPPTYPQAKTSTSALNAYEAWQTGGTAVPKLRPGKLNELNWAIRDVGRILASKDEERLDRALQKFFETYHIYSYFKQFQEEWVAISIQLSNECRAQNRWDDASRVLTATINAGPLDESQYYAHEPMAIMEFHLRQVDENGRCLPEAVAAASRIFTAMFKEKPRTHGTEVQRVGRHLFAQNLMLNESSNVHTIYWRILGLVKNPVAFTGWAIQELYQYEDYKTVIKYFLLNFSKMSPNNECYNKTIDCVVYSVEGLKGLKVNQVLIALKKMTRPGNGLLRTRWLMRLLQAHWHRNQDFPELKTLFEEDLSSGLLKKVTHPQGVYRTMIEIAIKAGEEDTARSYYKLLIQQYPEMTNDVALRGFIALALAKAGDWDSVFEAFTEMQDLRKEQEKEYDDAFVMVLKVFADSHPVAEVRDFVSKYTSVLAVRMHRYIVTLVANKYGDCHDIIGFMSWLEYCSRSGFALDSSICNAVLHNCRTKWKLPYRELQMLYSKIRQIDPSLIDDVGRRIMSQAALTAGKCVKDSKVNRGSHSKIVSVNKLAYTGRTTSRRDVYEAMNQELNSGRPTTAISIYKRALKYGMPSCRYCLRLAVMAALKNPQTGSASAMTLIHNAHERGEDVSPAVSVFIKVQLDHIQATAEDILLYMRNLITRFEALHIIIDPAVITHMAMLCSRLGHHERAIALCTLAMDRCGAGNLCFSRQSIKALLMAYSQLLDPEGMSKLIDDLLAGEFATDTSVRSYLKSTKRTVQRYYRNTAADALLRILEHGIEVMGTRRAENRKEGKMIPQETLRIMQEALAAMEGSKVPRPSPSPGEAKQQHSAEGSGPSRLVAVEA
ncbi:hypothetical protein F4819DRAFT_466255 [Hypoxylon fuscum]|nr:hypothetical protein F4819DRAFT_466255 [Hypoxylon fuscum]